MLQNIKVDIIYYLTATDFEMEFNLCGCCRMRLLTDKASDQKSLINMLARDVSRSRIIIACGPLFKDNGLISLVSTAIGSSLADVDSTYHIKDASGIQIIKGSTPLVTSDGYFGGCIIESGPQTIILLSESKGVRKKIMSTLIHPYIEELSLTQAQPAKTDEALDTVSSSEPSEAEEVSEDIPVAEEASEAQKTEPEVDCDEEAETEEISDPEGDENSAEEKPEEKSEDIEAAEEKQNATPHFAGAELEMFVEPEHVKFSKKSVYALDYSPSDKDNMFVASSDPDEPDDLEFGGRNTRKINIAIIIATILLAVVVILLVYYLVIVPLSYGTSISEHIKNIFSASEAMVNFLSIP